MKNKALFLDRDGVINVDHGYVHKKNDFEFLPGIFELVRAARELGYKVIVITNQAGIGRGFYTEDDFNSLTKWMCDEFSNNAGRIDAVYFSPYHPEHGLGNYRRDSYCRKPAPGMLVQAMKDFDLDMSQSIFVGDKKSDMAAGVAANVSTLLYLGRAQSDASYINVGSLAEVLSFI